MKKGKQDLFDTVIELGTSLVIGYTISRFIRIALARGDSMVPTIKNNQLMLVDCRAYKRRQPRRHDLIAFKAHQKKQPKIFLKRVIGLPGDHLLIYRGHVHINGECLEEPYLNEAMRNGLKLEMTIDEGMLFVMGDNRNHSLDSRSPSLGQVSIEKDVIGVIKVMKKEKKST